MLLLLAEIDMEALQCLQTVVAVIKSPASLPGSSDKCSDYQSVRGLQLLAEVDAETLESLKSAVAGIKEPAFQYDKSYVYECMEWGSPTSAPAAPGELLWMYLAKCRLWGLGGFISAFMLA